MAGGPAIRQLVVLFVSFGVIAGSSCAAFAVVSGDGARSKMTGVLAALLFAASMPVAAGAFALLVFRLWRRRVVEAWPSLEQAGLIAIAGAGLAFGGCGGFAMTSDATLLLPIAITFGAVFVAGLALAVGGGELGAMAMLRLIFRRSTSSTR